MRILLGNDDGWSAPGLAALAEGLADLGEVWIVAPEREQSAQSHAISLREPLRVRPTGPRSFACSGTPADAIYLALHDLLPAPPDVVVSGINWGTNLGNDVHYSGTVAAAREGCLHGFPAVAVSLERPEIGPAQWGTAAAVAKRVVGALVASPLAPWQFLNVNVPDRPLGTLRGLRAATLGRRRYDAAVDRRADPRGGTYFWIGGPHRDFGDDPLTDGHAVADGFASVTVLEGFPNPVGALDGLRTWTDA